MLKLEKSSQLSGVAIRIRERERFLEPRLLKALALALFLHLGGLALFHVTPFSLTSSFLFPPVRVQSDQPDQSISAIATQSLQGTDDEMSPPPVSLIPPLEFAYSPFESPMSPSFSFNPNAFDDVEKNVWPTWESPNSLHLEEPRIRLTVSGNLAERPLLKKNPLLEEMQPLAKNSSPAYISYRVQMDEETGELFWFELLESSGIREVDQLTEKILSTLRFAPDSTFKSIDGYLHFVVLIPDFHD